MIAVGRTFRVGGVENETDGLVSAGDLMVETVLSVTKDVEVYFTLS